MRMRSIERPQGIEQRSDWTIERPQGIERQTPNEQQGKFRHNR